MKVYVVREDGAIIETLSKAQLEEFVSDIQDLGDIAISDIVEINRQKSKKVWLGTKAEFEALQTKDKDTVYFTTDESYFSSVETKLNSYDAPIEDANDSFEAVKPECESYYDTMVSNVNADLTELGTLVEGLRNQTCKDPSISMWATDSSFDDSKIAVSANITFGAVPSTERTKSVSKSIGVDSYDTSNPDNINNNTLILSLIFTNKPPRSNCNITATVRFVNEAPPYFEEDKSTSKTIKWNEIIVNEPIEVRLTGLRINHYGTTTVTLTLNCTGEF